MSPSARTHLYAGVLFAAILLGIWLLWSLRSVLAYIFLAVVALLVYWGLYLFVASRLKARGEDPSDDEEQEEKG